MAALVGYVAADYLFHPPRFALVLNPAILAGLAGYLLTCGVIIYLGELMHRATERVEREVLERRRAEEALRASEERERARASELQTLMEAVPAVIWIARDAECRVITRRPGPEARGIARPASRPRGGSPGLCRGGPVQRRHVSLFIGQRHAAS
jgi:PAS domain-containing protein